MSSIAVSAVVTPSRLLFTLTHCMSALVAAIGVAIGFGWNGADLPVLARFVLFLSCGSMAGFGFYHGSRRRKTIHIDISGAGQIRIREAGATKPCAGADWPHVGESGDVVRLLPDSTLWSQLLLLRLQAESGKITVMQILPDSMPQETFRALAAACRWIASRRDDRDAPSGKKLESD
jgi:toxin CptA